MWRLISAARSSSPDGEGPALPVPPVLPLAPVGPITPCGPSAPRWPRGPRGPVRPRGPAGPRAPVDPRGPAGPRFRRSSLAIAVEVYQAVLSRALCAVIFAAHSTDQGPPSCLSTDVRIVLQHPPGQIGGDRLNDPRAPAATSRKILRMRHSSIEGR